MSAPTVIIAAPSSGSGKTILTMGLIGALRRQGLRVGSFKIGPDYIDPRFLEAASGRTCNNADSWAMRFATLAGNINQAGQNADIVVAEGVMGLFDGAPNGTGSTADIAAIFRLPVILLVDVQRMGASAAALIEGFRRHREDVAIDGIILGQVASPAHEHAVRVACDDTFSTPILGTLPRRSSLTVPSRHLGLVQASERSNLANVITEAADLVTEHIDLDRFQRLARHPSVSALPQAPAPLPPLGQRIAVASDEAFGFCYPMVLEAWRRAGCEIRFFSPLKNEAPANHGDAVFLPGGYPELHAALLASNATFLNGLRRVADRGATIYGECGGYMVLGKSLVDKEGSAHAMADLLPVETSFANPKLHLGYRKATISGDCILGSAGTVFTGHEFHYAAEQLVDGAPLFDCRDARDNAIGKTGCRLGKIIGSFVHLIDQA